MSACAVWSGQMGQLPGTSIKDGWMDGWHRVGIGLCVLLAVILWVWVWVHRTHVCAKVNTEFIAAGVIKL